MPLVPKRRARRRVDLHLVIAVPILACLVLFGLLGQYIAPYGSLQGSLSGALAPPAWQSPGTFTHLLGTDPIGRDILSRIILGTRITLVVAAVTLLISGGIGTIVGLVAGYWGGWVDAVAMRFADIVLSFPPILLPLLLAGAVGPSAVNVVLTISFILWAQFARQIRADVVALREESFIASARVSGVSSLAIITRHLLPNVASTIIVVGTLQVGWLILAQSLLSFVGAGLPPPAPDWGGMVASGTDYVVTAWWVPTLPGVAIVLTVLAFNLLGDWLQGRFDPRLRALS
jgi:peptide/nickel transport system permease protein